VDYNKHGINNCEHAWSKTVCRLKPWSISQPVHSLHFWCGLCDILGSITTSKDRHFW